MNTKIIGLIIAASMVLTLLTACGTTINSTNGTTATTTSETEIENTSPDATDFTVSSEDIDKFIHGVDDYYVLENSTNFAPESQMLFDSNIIKGIVIDDSNVDYTKTGEYKIKYSLVINEDNYKNFMADKTAYKPDFKPVSRLTKVSLGDTSVDYYKTIIVVNKSMADELTKKSIVVFTNDSKPIAAITGETVTAEALNESTIEAIKQEIESASVETSTTQSTETTQTVENTTSAPETTTEAPTTQVLTEAPTEAPTTQAPTTVTPPTEAPTEPATTAHQHSWATRQEIVTEAWDEQVISKNAWDEQVMSKPAWDEQVVSKPAWDEQVISREAWDEQVMTKEAWDEYTTIHHDAEYGHRYTCRNCGFITSNPNEIEDHLFSADHNGFLDEVVVIKSGWDEQVFVAHHDAEYTTVHHDAEYTTVHHDAEYITVHHDAEYTTVHHDAEYTTVHHDATYKTVTYCTTCGAVQ